MQMLLDHGADVFKKDRKGYTSLDWARLSRQEETAHLLEQVCSCAVYVLRSVCLWCLLLHMYGLQVMNHRLDSLRLVQEEQKKFQGITNMLQSNYDVGAYLFYLR